MDISRNTENFGTSSLICSCIEVNLQIAVEEFLKRLRQSSSPKSEEEAVISSSPVSQAA